ncbi:uncharacterized protein FOMMEDRAFT_155434 [Fomitiporia mediterranea MF3/22]|uniref:uncharacterized protein n=1 Tax=Fomitiporia mediterranea (strain MF3/22) TaxID=694068 RepID=UPI0004408DDF|nr:uncharacterized protein FOMMEDRAFT_155434 [Fomitiporia mediterranea MF3/22]EJD04307.1 hypothetical protein FOMMEDRAFT_155434 [Fomitiporia mediterranea MF3/22]
MGKVKKSRKRRKKSIIRSESPEDRILYNVEAILEAQPMSGMNGKRFWYLIKWYGYPGEDTWEPLESFEEGCERLLMSFWREVGTFNPNHKNLKLKPSKEWIDSEIWYFRKKYVEPEQGTWHSQPVTGYIEETGEKNIYD